MSASRLTKGILKLRTTSCLCTNLEVLHFTPLTHLVKIRQKRNMNYKGVNYVIEPKTPREVRAEVQEVVKPKHSIWLTSEHGNPRVSIEEAINMHKEYADPSMLSNVDGYLFADLDLDMSTKKKTKFVKARRDLLEFPNPFPYGPPKKIAVFCFKPEDVALAKEYGPVYCGGEELIQEFISGMITKDAIADLDFILATPDNMNALTTLRSTLRERLPKLGNDTIHLDVRYMLEKYTKGVIYDIKKPSEETGKAQIPFGKISQDLPCLVENFELMVDQLLALKPKAKNVAPLIKGIRVIAPPSHEQFELKVEDYLTVDKVKVKTKQKDKLQEDQEEEEEAVQAAG